MTETADLQPVLMKLDARIDALEEALEPLLKGDLSDIAAKLPLLDKAKLHALMTYAIESLLFSYLNLNGSDAKNHAVFKELTRVKGYFEKLKQVETAGQRSHAVDKQAASRFIKHALAGNQNLERQQSETLPRTLAAANLGLNSQSPTGDVQQPPSQLTKKRKQESISSSGHNQSTDDGQTTKSKVGNSSKKGRRT